MHIKTKVEEGRNTTSDAVHGIFLITLSNVKGEARAVAFVHFLKMLEHADISHEVRSSRSVAPFVGFVILT